METFVNENPSMNQKLWTFAKCELAAPYAWNVNIYANNVSVCRWLQLAYAAFDYEVM